MQTIITLDGESSRDLDDAFSIEKHNAGWRLSIYIAAPAYLLPYNAPAVKLAEERLLTVYAGKEGIKRPLIDDETINDTCTLLPGEAKPAVRLTILISDDGKAVAERPVFEPSVTSREKMSYISFGEALNDKDNAHHNIATLATDCARRLFYNRTLSGDTLSFINEEAGTYTDEEGRVRTVSLREIHGQIVVQEFMILNNHLMTLWAEANKLPVLYRNHEPIDISDMKDSHPEIYEAYKSMDIEKINNMKNHLFQPAKFSTVNKGHFGLGLNAYGTFSSPLRRYPDLHNQYVVLGKLLGRPVPTLSEARCEAINKTLLSIKSERSEASKASAGYSAMKVLSTTGKVTANQFSQIIKRHPSTSAKIRACYHLVENAELHASSATWGTLITHPFPVNKVLRGKLMNAYDGVSLSRGIWDFIHLTMGIKPEDNSYGVYCEDKVRFLLATSLGETPQQYKPNASAQDNKKSQRRSVDEQEAERRKILNDNTEDNMFAGYVPGTNYKGAVLEHLQKLKLTAPGVKMINKGKPHLPVWVASFEQTSPSEWPSDLSATDTAKKAAEAKLFFLLQKHLPDIPAPVATPIAPQVNTGAAGKDFKSAVNLYCQQNKLPFPTFNTRPDGAGFTCDVSLTVNGVEMAGAGSGARKKAAEQAACEELFTQL